MRGMNNQNNRPRLPVPGMAGFTGRPQLMPNLNVMLMQQQQQMLLHQQRQEFLARQQIVQQEQLQKQRLLRQQQEQQALLRQQRPQMLNILQQQISQPQRHRGLSPIIRPQNQPTSIPTMPPPGFKDASHVPLPPRNIQQQQSTRYGNASSMLGQLQSKPDYRGRTPHGAPQSGASFDSFRTQSTYSEQSSSFDRTKSLERDDPYPKPKYFASSSSVTNHKDKEDRVKDYVRPANQYESQKLDREGQKRDKSDTQVNRFSLSKDAQFSRHTALSTREDTSKSLDSRHRQASQYSTREKRSTSRGKDMSYPRDQSREKSLTRSRDSSVSRRVESSHRSTQSPRRDWRRRDRDEDSDRQGRNWVRALSSSARDVRSSSSSDRSSYKDYGGSRTSERSQYRCDLLKNDQSSERSSSPLSGSSSFSNYDKLHEMIHTEDSRSTSGNSSIENKKEEPKEEEDSVLEHEEEVISFTRSCPADLYFTRNRKNCNMEASNKMVDLENKFQEEMHRRLHFKVEENKNRDESGTSSLAKPSHSHLHHHHYHPHHKCGGGKASSCSSSSSSSSSSDEDDEDEGNGNQIMDEWDRRKQHPQSLHPELWFNLKGQGNDGPLCRCSIKSRQSGIRHDIYPGEKAIPLCDQESNNLDKLFHYRMTMSPYTNFLTKVPTLIHHDDHEYIFEGFSLFSHAPLDNIPPCKLLRFNIEYTIRLVAEEPPENFTVCSLNLFNKFIFTELLEMVDMDWTGPKDVETGQPGCNRFHLLPRFCRTLPDSAGGKEVLSMNTVLSFIMRSLTPLVEDSCQGEIMKCGESEWHAKMDHLRGMIVTKPGMRPAAIRIDQLDRKVVTLVNCSKDKEDKKTEDQKKLDTTCCSSKSDQEGSCTRDAPRYPLIIHQGNRPAQLSYAGDPHYRKAWKQYVKFRHLLNSKPKVMAGAKAKIRDLEARLRDIRMKKTMKREVTVELSSQGFLSTGLRADLFQHALMIPVLLSHLRFHICLGILEETLKYSFTDRNLLQLSLTHTSYRTNYGTNPDHTRNSLTNCGMRQLDYGDRRIHYQNTRKRGITILVDIMSRMGKQEETASEIPHNERLEFLGDAVIEFLTSVHLFYMFPWLEEGGLTTFRMALVQNQHLAILARKLKLQDFMLYVHGPDLCHESDLRHAMANCCEAIMGALFLDGGIDVADKIFSRALFDDDDVLLKTWTDIPKHILQHEEPGGDRHWIKSSPVLQKLESFEESIGIKFNHIRLLAKAFTHRNVGVNPLTRGHNQRLEFLGDTVLQLISSEYLYHHYPEHHEGHLSLLRSSLVNSRTQGQVYDDLGMSKYVIFNEKVAHDGLDMKTKQRADILESFVGALFVDKDLDYCRTFCDVCFFPRLKNFIMNQDWNDPKSQLQQCCLTLREVGGGEPDIPVYKVIESIGPTNTRKYVVAVYFRGKRLARGTGHNIQQAEMAAATQALRKRAELFPILQHQRRFLDRIRKGEMEMDQTDMDNGSEDEEKERKGNLGTKRSYSDRPSKTALSSHVHKRRKLEWSNKGK